MSQIVHGRNVETGLLVCKTKATWGRRTSVDFKGEWAKDINCKQCVKVMAKSSGVTEHAPNPPDGAACICDPSCAEADCAHCGYCCAEYVKSHPVEPDDCEPGRGSDQ